MEKNIKVAVGISGGVDSSVAAALLLKQGYDVVGVHLRCFDEDVPYCTATEDREMAIRVATHLDIPLKIYDFRAEYKERVIDYMLSEYEANRTPNPDVVCNRDIKFGILYEHVFSDLGVDFVATGHYACVARDQKSLPRRQAGKIKNQNEGGDEGFRLMMAKDKSKDQSYFLALLSQKQLSRVMFPLGDLLKTEVRQLAAELKLPTATRPDSQGICFVGEVSVREFLKGKINVTFGEVVDVSGNVIGSHEGLPLYTIGQRHGFTLNKSFEAPMYVVGKDVVRNRLIVAGREELLTNVFEVKMMNWLGEDKGDRGNKGEIRVRIRHLGELHACKIESRISNLEFSQEVRVVLEEPVDSVAPGQLAVFYSGEEVLGAGEILS